MSTKDRVFFRWLAQLPGWVKLAASVLLPGVATLIALPLPQEGSTSTVAAMFYLVAVIAAALIGGQRGGLLASLLSFLGLNFFFTPPFQTFAVEKSEDIVALVAFLAVSSLVANLFTQVLNQMSRAEGRERETTLLYQLASSLLGQKPTESVLEEFAKDLVELFSLARCEVVLMSQGQERRAAEVVSPRADGSDVSDPVTIALKTDREHFGTVVLTAWEDSAFGERQKALAEAFISQAALVIESARLEERARGAQAEAEASRIRAALFSSVTHDLRTPLASIKASATSLLEEGVTFDELQRKDLLQTIAEESDRLNRLIGNLLDLARLRAGALTPKTMPTDIEDVIESICARFKKISTNGHLIVLKIREGIPLVPIDLMQIDQVISNLLENAYRYSPDGSEITITAARWQSAVEIQVADRGKGIPVSERDRVFEEFYRREDGDRSDGAGLGLSIARAIVQAHGGEIWIRETPGGGATVAFRLPINGEVLAR